jgi:hypothetical protein
MNAADRATAPKTRTAANGAGAAAILSAGIGSFALAVLTLVADRSAAMKSLLVFYQPTGALSGVTTGAIVIWLLSWAILEWRWGKKTVEAGRISMVAMLLLGLSLLLTFPPIGDWL